MLPRSHEWLVENSSGCNECCNNWKIVRSTAVITLKKMTLNIMVAILSSAGHTLTHSNRKKGNGLLRGISQGSFKDK
jgi:hypothetical protein